MLRYRRSTGRIVSSAGRGALGTSSYSLGLLSPVSSTTLLASRSYATVQTFAQPLTEEEIRNQAQYPGVLRFVNAYRTYGHVGAEVDPLKRRVRSAAPLLDRKLYGLENIPVDKKIPLVGILHCDKKEATITEIENILKAIYCGPVGVEFTHLETPEEQEWFARCYERLASNFKLSGEEKKSINTLLQKSEVFDHYLHMKFRAVKRYGLEGCESLMPCMDTLFKKAAAHSVQEAVISMPHRGRLNFLTGLLNYPSSNVFSKIQGYPDAPDAKNPRGTGDVLSHIAQSVDLQYGDKSVHVSLLHNPSHLEASNPVAMGKVRCKQDLTEKEAAWNKALCVMIHGDAAMSGQGIVPETLLLAGLPDYATGGTIHVVANNQLGFTTDAYKGRSSWYCTDVGKMIHAPALHVNADEPEAVVLATQVAIEYRQKWFKDVFIDLNGYRRHGHNEMDEPAFTQPTMYDTIRDRPTLPSLYANKLVQENVISSEDLKKLKDELRGHLEKQFSTSQSPRPGIEVLQKKWKGLDYPSDMTVPVETGVARETLLEVGMASIDPRGITLHPRLVSNFTAPRKAKLEAGDKIDWATAEALAFGSLLVEGHNVRISGQDVGRGTFSQRHVRFTDQKTDEGVVPLNHIRPKQGKIRVADSPLSELAVMGYEYGYSLEDPNTLPIWEAQFGDFSNGAQIVIDQFISTGEDKWWRQSGLVLLLPHGYDGAGPEHSSCRIERYLQLCKGDSFNPSDVDNQIPNMQVIYPTTPANYFHALRRQIKRTFRKPLIVVGPKTMLRASEAVSPLSAMASPSSFQPVLSDTIDPAGVDNVVFCSGKLYYDLVKERERLNASNTAFVRLEELCPFPHTLLANELSRYKNAKTYKWVQEEPQNMGAWTFVMPRFLSLLNANTLPIKYVGRPAASASAVGFSGDHKNQHAAVLAGAF